MSSSSSAILSSSEIKSFSSNNVDSSSNFTLDSSSNSSFSLGTASAASARLQVKTAAATHSGKCALPSRRRKKFCVQFASTQFPRRDALTSKLAAKRAATSKAILISTKQASPEPLAPAQQLPEHQVEGLAQGEAQPQDRHLDWVREMKEEEGDRRVQKFLTPPELEQQKFASFQSRMNDIIAMIEPFTEERDFGMVLSDSAKIHVKHKPKATAHRRRQLVGLARTARSKAHADFFAAIAALRQAIATARIAAGAKNDIRIFDAANTVLEQIEEEARGLRKAEESFKKRRTALKQKGVAGMLPQ